MTTPTEARDDVYGIITTAWGALGPIDYEDRPHDEATTAIPPKTIIPWIRITMHHTNGAQVTLSNSVGNRRFRRYGVIMVQVFSPLGSSLRDPENHSKIVNDALEGVATPHDVLIRNVRMDEKGSDGHWFQTNVIADFEYDEVK